MTNAEFDSFTYCIPALGLMRALKTLIISQVFDDLLYLQKDSAPNVTSVAEMYLFMIHLFQASTTQDCAQLLLIIVPSQMTHCNMSLTFSNA